MDQCQSRGQLLTSFQGHWSKHRVPRKGGVASRWLCDKEDNEGDEAMKRKAMKTMKIHRFIASPFSMLFSIYRTWTDSPWLWLCPTRARPTRTSWNHGNKTPPLAKPPFGRCWRQTLSQNKAPRDWSIRISPETHMDQCLPNLSESSGLHQHRSIECSSLKLLARESVLWCAGTTPILKKNLREWRGKWKSFIWVPINSGNRSGSCSENCGFRIAQVLGCHSENEISNSENGISNISRNSPRVKTFISCYRTPGPQKGFRRVAEGVSEGFSKGFRRGQLRTLLKPF